MKKQTIESVESLPAKGYFIDTNNLHKRIIEDRQCKCRKNYIYAGYSDLNGNYFAFGICRNCNHAVHFNHLSDNIVSETFEFIERQRSVA